MKTQIRLETVQKFLNFYASIDLIIFIKSFAFSIFGKKLK